MNSRSRFKRNVAIAVIGGGIVGGAAGFWSQRHPALPEQGSPAAAAIIEPVPVPTQAVSLAPPAAAKPEPLVDDSGGSVLARARAMAQHADVASLLALRDEIIRRSTQSRQSESPATRRELEEV